MTYVMMSGSYDQVAGENRLRSGPGRPKKTAGRIIFRPADEEDNEYAWLYLADGLNRSQDCLYSSILRSTHDLPGNS
jgi:hypothetical protein